jgi:hypothetical protein
MPKICLDLLISNVIIRLCSLGFLEPPRYVVSTDVKLPVHRSTGLLLCCAYILVVHNCASRKVAP